jgi:hypothetical protein
VGATCCDGVCRNLATPEYCGACNHHCSSGELCVGGACCKVPGASCEQGDSCCQLPNQGPAECDSVTNRCVVCQRLGDLCRIPSEGGGQDREFPCCNGPNGERRRCDDNTDHCVEG